MSRMRTRRTAAAAADSPAYLDRQKSIRTAAGEVFREKGFHATKLQDVAERAGMDRASLYYYVGSKDDLFRDVVSKAVAANVSDAEELARLDLPASEKLSRLFRGLMASFERDYPFLYVFVQEDPEKLRSTLSDGEDPWAVTLDQSERYFSIVKQIVADGMESGEIQSVLPPSVVANSLIGMINSSHLWFEPNGLLGAEEIGTSMARMVLDGLRVARPKDVGRRSSK